MTYTVDTATRSLFSVDADLLLVAATTLGPFLAVIFGLLVYRYQQQVQYSSERFLSDGIQSLYRAVSALLSIHLQNYQIGSYIIRTIRNYEHGHPLAPTPAEIPEFVGLQLESLPIDSVLLVQELLGDKVILDWVMHAISDVTLEAKEAEFQIRQPTAALYRSSVDVDRDELTKALTLVLEGWNTRVSTHFALRDRLHDLDSHFGKKRPWTLSGHYAVRERDEVKEIVKEMKQGLCKVMVAHNQTAEVLRTGGYTTEEGRKNGT